MKDTYFYLPKEKRKRLATLYSEDSTKHIIKDRDTFELNGTVYVNYPNMDGTYYSGGGGLSSTAYDYSVFMVCRWTFDRTNSAIVISFW